MKIHLSRTADKIIGACRVSTKTYEIIGELAKKEGVSKQEIVRAILDEVIDGIEIF